MKNNNKLIALAAMAITLGIFTLSGCGASGSEADTTTAAVSSDTSAETTSEAVTLETTVSETSTSPETTTLETTATEISSSETTETSKETTSEPLTSDEEYKNNSEFVTTVDSIGEADVPLDNTVFYEDIGIGEVVNGKAYYIYCTSDKSAEIYGVTYDSSDKAHTWLYTPYYTDTQQFENNHYIIIKHDGITEEFPCDWYDGYDTPANIEFYEHDFDSDGTKEIAIKRLAMHGQGCGDELYMFKKTSEGYVLYLCRGDNALAELNNNVTIDIDNENHTVTAKWNNSEISYTAEISENLNSARFDFNQTFYVKNNKLYISAELKNTDFPFTRYFKVDAELVFDGKQFSLSSPVFGEIDFD